MRNWKNAGDSDEDRGKEQEKYRDQDQDDKVRTMSFIQRSPLIRKKAGF